MGARKRSSKSPDIIMTSPKHIEDHLDNGSEISLNND